MKTSRWNFWQKIRRQQWKNTWLFLYWTVLKRLILEGYTFRASALAFTTVLTVVPLVSIVVSLITHFPIFSHIIGLARSYILDNFIPHSGQTIESYLDTFSKQVSGLPTWSVLFLLLTVAMSAMTIESSLSAIWSEDHVKRKRFAAIFHWLMLIFTPFLIGIGVLISSYIFSLSLFSNSSSFTKLNIPLLAFFPFFLNTGIFTLFYMTLPNYQVLWRDRLLGACTASVLFELGKKGFSFYIMHIESYQLLYGALAAIPIFLIWLYISWLIILFGALVVHTRDQLRKKPVL